jgi:hypothetical protein
MNGEKIERNNQLVLDHQNGMTCSKLSKKYKIHREVVSYIIRRTLRRRKDAKEWGGLNYRFMNALRYHGNCHSLLQAQKMTDKQLLNIKNIGIQTLEAIRKAKL